jgi:hypothetical protein
MVLGAIVLLVPMIIKIILWVVTFLLLRSAWNEWNKGTNAETRDYGTIAGYVVGAYISYTVAGNF